MKLLIFSLLFSFSAAMYAKGIKIKVNLSPAGSFDIETKKIKGKAVRQGGGFVANKVYVKTKDLKTGLDLRDNHLHDKLEKEKYSKIEILDGKAKGGKGVAVIKVKNIKKKIGFTYKENGGDLVITFPISLKDFNFSGINYAGVGVKDKVMISAEVPIK